LVRTLIHALLQYRPEEIEQAFLNQQLFAIVFGIPFPFRGPLAASGLSVNICRPVSEIYCANVLGKASFYT
jgi:hypothetical protein